MSASKQKKLRQQNPEAVSAKEAAQQDEHKKMRKYTVIGIIVAVVVLLLFVASIFINNNFLQKHTTAATVGDYEVSPAMARYFYLDAYNQYKSYLSYFGTDLAGMEDQVYDEESGKTWGDLLMETAESQMATTYSIYDDAMKNGYTLTEDDQAALDSAKSYLSVYASYSGYGTADAYTAAIYGKGCTEENYLEYYKLQMIVSNYTSAYQENLSYTADEIKAESEQNASSYNSYDYRYFYLSSASLTDSDTLSEEEIATQLETRAKTMAEESKGNEDRFAELAEENASESMKTYYEDKDASLRKSAIYTSIVSQLQSWISDASRAYGDTTYVKTDDGSYYIALYIGMNDNNYNAMQIRQIVIEPEETTADDGTTSQDWDGAKEKLDALQSSFEENGSTEDAFTNLVASYSSDSDTSSTGGLYEAVYHNQFADEANDWIFDSARKAGDFQVFEEDSGYRVVYFVGTGDVYRDYLVDTALRTADYNDWYTQISATLTVTEHSFGMKFVDKSIS